MAAAPTSLDRLDFAPRRHVIVAVSGGGDSLALLHLLLDHIRRGDVTVEPVVASVDHSLRAASASEAAGVADIAARLGLRHLTLRWEGDKPGTGIMQAAREARYALLASAARAHGTDLVLTGHTLDDVAETVAMRVARGTEGPGLAGIAPATLLDGNVWFARPLLESRREALRGYLTARRIGWLDDPSNRDPAYERVRVRGMLAEPEIVELAGQASRAAAARLALSDATAALLDRHVRRPAPGLFRLDPAIFDASTAERRAALQVLRVVLSIAGGTTHLPDSPRSEALVDRLAARPGRTPALRVALSRALVDLRSSGLWIRREDRDVPTMRVTGEAIWDGRWRVALADGGAPVSIGPCGQSAAGAAELAGSVDPGTPPALVRAALALEPVARRGDDAVPLHQGRAPFDDTLAQPVAAPFAHLLSSFDHATAAAAHRLLGIAEPPAPPFNDHNATQP